MIPKFLRPEVIPFVDVELVPASADSRGPVIDVAIVPVGKRRRFASLPTLSATNARPRATPKDQLGTKLDRAIARKAARLLDAKKLRVWAFAVKERDQWKDRKTGGRVRRTRQLDPLRAEAHHIAGKDDWAVRYDIRNGITLSYATHFAVQRHRLRIVGSAFFTKGGTRYIDGTYAVGFVRV
jgi:hypothetical protein